MKTARRFAPFVFFLTTACLGSRGASPVAAPSPFPSPSIPPPRTHYVAPTFEEAGRTVMPLTFPDGSQAELVYEPKLGLSNASPQFFTSFIDGCPSDITGAARGMPSGDPVDLLRHPQGGFTHVYENDDGYYDVVLDIEDEPWTVRLWTEEKDSAEGCANSLRVERAGGWVIVRAVGAARVASVGDHGGPQIGLINIGGNHERWILLFPERCTPSEVDGDQTFADWCDASGLMRVHVYSDSREFIDRVREGLEIRNICHAAG
ncbi:MAG TPA: hypothetical protein VM638_00875 [Actinomycetota bacterium]|nr:hypothetical protein [Actinomycetota bacterium]